jgi:uncharacterized protein
VKLHLSGPDGRYYFTGYGEDHVLVNGERMSFGLILTPALLDREALVSVSFELLLESHFSHLAGLGAEIILLGTGPKLRFPHPRLTRPLIEARIGLEVMDTGAACRTYNILAGEGRKVAAAILA